MGWLVPAGWWAGLVLASALGSTVLLGDDGPVALHMMCPGSRFLGKWTGGAPNGSDRAALWFLR